MLLHSQVVGVLAVKIPVRQKSHRDCVFNAEQGGLGTLLFYHLNGLVLWMALLS
jgi:hypothetical protein